MRLLVNLILTMICLGTPAFAQSKAGQTEAKSIAVKADILSKARGVREQNGSRIRDITQRLANMVSDTQSENTDADMTKLKISLQEYVARQEFWDRLIFQIDSRFSGGDIRDFLQNRLLEMAKVEATSPNSDNLWKFFRYTSDIVKSLPERKDDVIAVIEGYVRSTSPANPENPRAYLSQQNYTNGTHSEAAHTMSREDAGEEADRRLQEISK